MDKKKRIQAGLDSLIPPQPAKKRPLDELIAEAKPSLRRGRPQHHAADRPATERGCKEGEARYTVILKKDQAEALKNIAYWLRVNFKEVLAVAAEQYIERYQKKNGAVKPRKN